MNKYNIMKYTCIKPFNLYIEIFYGKNANNLI